MVATVNLPDATYATLVIDPPWPSNGYPMGRNNAGCVLCRPHLDKNCKCRTVHNSKFDYGLMGLEELAAMDIPSLLKPDAFVFLWTIIGLYVTPSTCWIHGACRTWLRRSG